MQLQIPFKLQRISFTIKRSRVLGKLYFNGQQNVIVFQ